MRHHVAVARHAMARDPFVIFLIVSAAIFALYWVASDRRETISVPAAVQKSLSDDYELMTGKQPDAAAKARLIDDYVANELLFREAVARGMHMTDKATKQRLIDRVRFMIAGVPAEPSEDALIGYYTAHPELYRAEPRMSVQHVFFERAPGDPAGLLARLRAGGTVAGDDFWMGHDLPDYGISMLRGMFGTAFLKRLEAAKAGEWFGPVQSTRGWHFARVTERGPARALPYPEARDQVLQDYQAQQTGAAVASEVDRLKAAVNVDVE
ncbi:peptidyl-prolyl cis-trans isomerase [Sphingomonas sp. IW22]|uniref:peptidyl-prolyl cis-trans isomerase n=1 Tax=Sphingomonas sp. IW22 TaxID=3242489 RepID=UPI00352015AA